MNLGEGMLKKLRLIETTCRVSYPEFLIIHKTYKENNLFTDREIQREVVGQPAAEYMKSFVPIVTTEAAANALQRLLRDGVLRHRLGKDGYSLTDAGLLLGRKLDKLWRRLHMPEVEAGPFVRRNQRKMTVGTLKLEELTKLPHFFVRDKFERDDKVYLEGVFEPRYESSHGFMFVIKPPVYQDAIFTVLWTATDEQASIIEYYVNWDTDLISVGSKLPCWQFDLSKLLLILDVDVSWEERRFRPSDAWSYSWAQGWRATLSPGERPPKGAENIEKRNGAWDHEHCTFCNATISERAEPTGHVAKNAFGFEDWVCKKCYVATIAPHRVR